jgi:hypothetical protein
LETYYVEKNETVTLSGPQEGTILAHGFYLERLCTTPMMGAQWIEFETAATEAHARKFVEDNYRLKAKKDTQ